MMVALAIANDDRLWPVPVGRRPQPGIMAYAMGTWRASMMMPYPSCPGCGRAMTAADMKANGNVDGEEVEWYVCPGCGTRFRIASSSAAC